MRSSELYHTKGSMLSPIVVRLRPGRSTIWEYHTAGKYVFKFMSGILRTQMSRSYKRREKEEARERLQCTSILLPVNLPHTAWNLAYGRWRNHRGTARRDKEVSLHAARPATRIHPRSAPKIHKQNSKIPCATTLREHNVLNARTNFKPLHPTLADPNPGF